MTTLDQLEEFCKKVGKMKHLRSSIAQYGEHERKLRNNWIQWFEASLVWGKDINLSALIEESTLGKLWRIVEKKVSVEVSIRRGVEHHSAGTQLLVSHNVGCFAIVNELKTSFVCEHGFVRPNPYLYALNTSGRKKLFMHPQHGLTPILREFYKNLPGRDGMRVFMRSLGPRLFWL